MVHSEMEERTSEKGVKGLENSRKDPKAKVVISIAYAVTTSNRESGRKVDPEWSPGGLQTTYITAL